MMGKTGTQKGFDSFLKEARKMAKLGGIPGVVGVKSVFIQNETAYIVMDFIEGETLLKKLQKNGPMDFDSCVKLMTPIIQALAEVHEHGIIHRDISPDNIMWMPDNTLKLLDFGCARSMEDGKSMSVLLKHGFAPVEQYQTRGQGPWTDIYSLCATVYYCITGTLPTSAVERLEGDALVPPTALGAELTPREETALLWGLAVQPTRRPQNIELLIGQLCPAPPKKPIKRKKPEKPGGAGKAKAGKVSAKRIIGLAAAAIVLVVALVLIFGEGKEPSYGSPAYEPGGSIPAASASPTPEPTPTFTPVDGVSDGVEYTSYGDHVVVTGYEGAAEDILAIPEEIDGLPVTAIGDEAFRGQSALDSVIIPGSVKEVGDLAFAGCTSLRMVFARRDMEIGGGVFEGCDELRALFKTSDFDTDLADWGFSANVVSFAIGQDTGAGALVIIYVTDDGVVYGVTEDECAVVLDIPAGLGTVTLADSVGDYPVVWMYAGALENADDDVEIYLADGMGFPYEIRNDANWAFKDDCGPDSFCFNWYLSCYLAEETNDRRPDGAEEVVPVREYVEAAIQRSEEIYSTYQHERPDGSKFSTIFEEYGIEVRYTTQWIDHFPVDDLEAELLDCAESLVDRSESYGVYYVYMGAATYYGGDEVYLCRLAGADDQDG